MNFLEIVLLIISVLLIIRGFHNGILRMIFNLLGFILIGVIINTMNPTVYSSIHSSKLVSSRVDNIASNYINSNKDTKNINDSLREKDNKDFTMSALLREKVLSKLDELELKKEQNDISDKINDIIKKSAKDLYFRGMSILCSMIIASIIVLIIKLIINIIGHIPIIRGTSKLLGGLIGLVEAFLLICFVICMIQCFATTKTGKILYNEYSKSDTLKSINEYNPIYKFF